MLIYTLFALAECQTCGTKHAIVPVGGRQYEIYRREFREYEEPTHICLGGLACLRGHRLKVTAEVAVHTKDGRWLVIADERVPLGVN